MESVYSQIIRETIISDVEDFVDIIDEAIVDTGFLYYYFSVPGYIEMFRIVFKRSNFFQTRSGVIQVTKSK